MPCQHDYNSRRWTVCEEPPGLTREPTDSEQRRNHVTGTGFPLGLRARSSMYCCSRSGIWETGLLPGAGHFSPPTHLPVPGLALLSHRHDGVQPSQPLLLQIRDRGGGGSLTAPERLPRSLLEILISVCGPLASSRAARAQRGPRPGLSSLARPWPHPWAHRPRVLAVVPLQGLSCHS